MYNCGILLIIRLEPCNHKQCLLDYTILSQRWFHMMTVNICTRWATDTICNWTVFLYIFFNFFFINVNLRSLMYTTRWMNGAGLTFIVSDVEWSGLIASTYVGATFCLYFSYLQQITCKPVLVPLPVWQMLLWCAFVCYIQYWAGYVISYRKQLIFSNDIFH